MDDTVGGLDVSGDDVDVVVQLNRAINHGDGDGRAVEGRCLGHVDHIGGAGTPSTTGRSRICVRSPDGS
jgi:hypothetical protein